MKKFQFALFFAGVIALASTTLAAADSSADNEKVVRSFISSWTTKPIDETWTALRFKKA